MDYIYAGLRNHITGCEIWRTNDLNKPWVKVVENGFYNLNNSGAWVAEIFNSYLYVGTMNFIDGCEVYRSKDGLNWECVVGRKSDTKIGFGSNGNFYAWSMCVYDSYLYIGTNNLYGGGELWRTNDGINWNPIFAYKRGDFPMEFAPEIDYDTHFMKAILSPINAIIDPLGMPEISKRLSVVMDIFGGL